MVFLIRNLKYLIKNKQSLQIAIASQPRRNQRDIYDKENTVPKY